MSTQPSFCAVCARPTPLHLLDAKPARLARDNGPDGFVRLVQALIDNEDCDTLLCEPCYGLGWVEGACD